MTELAKRSEELVAAFSHLESWEERYKEIISRGQNLSLMPEEYRTDEYKVRGCQSQVWLHARRDGDHVIYVGDSDALIVKGLLAVLLGVYSGATPEEILKSPPDFIKQLGFETHLTPTRAGGLLAIYRQMIYYATALQYLG